MLNLYNYFVGFWRIEGPRRKILLYTIFWMLSCFKIIVNQILVKSIFSFCASKSNTYLWIHQFVYLILSKNLLISQLTVMSKNAVRICASCNFAIFLFAQTKIKGDTIIVLWIIFLRKIAEFIHNSFIFFCDFILKAQFAIINRFFKYILHMKVSKFYKKSRVVFWHFWINWSINNFLFFHELKSSVHTIVVYSITVESLFLFFWSKNTESRLFIILSWIFLLLTILLFSHYFTFFQPVSFEFIPSESVIFSNLFYPSFHKKVQCYFIKRFLISFFHNFINRLFQKFKVYFLWLLSIRHIYDLIKIAKSIC